MRKVFILLVVMGLSSSAFAVNAVVQNLVKTTAQRIAASGTESQNWFTATNWNGAVGVPQNDTATQCNGVTLYGSAATSWNSTSATDSIVIANLDAQTGQLRVGSSNTTSTGAPAALTMNSGTLTIGARSAPQHMLQAVADLCRLAPTAAVGSTGRNGLFYMNGGDLQALNGQGAITIGNGNATGANCFGYMFMTGGTVESLLFRIGRYAGVTGAVYLSGGTITTNNFTMGVGTASMQISGTGKFIVNGDQTTLIQGYIDNGWINDDVQMSLTMNPGKTTLYVVPEPATICLLGLGALSLMSRKK